MSNQRVVKDARFASLHNDPRFARPKVKDNKVKVDSRFATVLSDPRFDDSKAASRKRAREPSVSGSDEDEKADTRVKRAKKGAAAPSFAEKMYEAASGSEDSDSASDGSDSDGSESSSGAGARGGSSKGSVGAGQSARGGIESRLARLNRLARGEALPEDYSSASSDDEDMAGGAGGAEEEELEGEEVDMEAAQRMLDPDAPDLRPEYTPDGSESRRLALVNCDWDHLRAVDIYAALASFVPAGGSLTRVTVYPSDYGMKRLEEEARFGPVALKGAAMPPAPAPSSSSSSSSSSSKAAKADEAGVEGTGEEFDPIKLRAYELNKMKYYYAVVECDCTNTAISIYSQCDGMEFEATANTFDLRFVPDDTEFTNPPRDAATSVPQDYEPPEFRTAALQSSKVQLTWDAEDPHRARALNWDKLKKKAGLTAGGGGRGGDSSDEEDAEDSDALADIKAYLASSSEDSDEEASEEGSDDDDEEEAAAGSKKSKRKDAKRLRALLLGGEGGGEDSDEEDGGKKKKSKKKDKKKKGKKGGDSDDDGDKVMTISFNPGLGKDIIKKRKEKKQLAGETVFEAEQRKLREKRKAKKAARKEAAAAAGGDEDAASGSDVGSGDDFFADASGKPKAADKKKKQAKKGKHGDAAGSGDEGSGAASEEDEDKRRARLQMLMGDAVSDDSDGENARRVLKGSLKSRERKAAKLAAEGSGEGKNSRNYSLQALLKQQKEMDRLEAKKARQNKATARDEAATAGVAKLAGGFDVNAADPRFAAAMADPRFAIDPTAPQFKDTQGMRKIVGERVSAAAAASSGSEALPAARRPMVVVAGGSSASGSGAGERAPSTSETTSEVARLAAAVQSKFGGAKPAAPVAAKKGSGGKPRQ